MSLIFLTLLYFGCLITCSIGMSWTGSAQTLSVLQSCSDEILCSPSRTATLKFYYIQHYLNLTKSNTTNVLTNHDWCNVQQWERKKALWVFLEITTNDQLLIFLFYLKKIHPHSWNSMSLLNVIWTAATPWKLEKSACVLQSPKHELTSKGILQEINCFLINNFTEKVKKVLPPNKVSFPWKKKLLLTHIKHKVFNLTANNSIRNDWITAFLVIDEMNIFMGF